MIQPPKSHKAFFFPFHLRLHILKHDSSRYLMSNPAPIKGFDVALEVVSEVVTSTKGFRNLAELTTPCFRIV
jgi:hypothetical protein